MKLSVLIPTYNRPEDLCRGLDSLKHQTRRPDQVVVTVRKTDTVTHAALGVYDASPLSLTIAEAPEVGGFSGAINAGLEAVTGDAVAVTDDDTAPRPDWLQRIEQYFESDPLVGGVGGRDIQPGKEAATEPVVGLVCWWGKVIGNHHLGSGGAREVDILKGCNCAYRTAPFKVVGFDKRLLGKGMQMHTEVSLGLSFRRAGWKLIYDPEVALDHYPAQRHDIDTRGVHFNPEAHFNHSHNLTLALWQHFSPVQRLVFLLWQAFLGTRTDPGLLQILRLAPRDRDILPRFRATWKGISAALRTAARTKRPETLPPSAPPNASQVAAPAASPASV